MRDPFKIKTGSDSLEEHAALWVWKRDRGLTATEQDEFSLWLAADPRHAQKFARLQSHWSRTYAMAEWRPEHGAKPNPDLLEPEKRKQTARRVWLLAGSLAAAIVISVYVPWLRSPQPSSLDRPASQSAAFVSVIEQRRLDDGSLVELNRGAIVSVQFTASERRLTLERGEAHFTVEKNPNRPFVVVAHGVSVRAVGTAFDVRMDATSVDVLVTEGKVEVHTIERKAELPLESGADIPIVEAGQRAVVSLVPAGPPPDVVRVSTEDIDRFLAWQPRVIDFTAAPLSAIVTEFNRHNSVHLVIADAALGSLRLSASFPSDNVDGFVRLLEAGFDVRAERHGDDEIVLRKAQ